MKGRFLAVPALLCAVTLGGCNFANFSFEDMLRPPKIMGDEAEIEHLISDAAGGSYTLKYPKSGSYRSAIIMNDLDGDNINEAVAFFRVKDENVANLHMLIMNESDGVWRVSGDFVTETTDVDCVAFSDIGESDALEILVGYTTYTPNVNFLSCYSYQKGETAAIQSGQNYSAFYCGNLDNSDKNEVVTLSLYNPETEAKATMLEYNKKKKALFAKASVAMDPNIVKYKNVSFSGLDDGVKGIVVDGSFVSEEINTQVIYYNSELAVLRNPLYSPKVKSATQRTCTVLSNDVDKDLNVEIPIVAKLPYSGKEELETVADKISWCRFNPAKEKLEVKLQVAANYDYHYTLRLSDKWAKNTVTAYNEGDTMTFFAWGKKARGAKLFTVRVFSADVWDQGTETDGFALIYRDNDYAYTFHNDDPDSELALTDDEIKTAFSILDENI